MDLRKKWDSLSPKQKKGVEYAVTAASFIPVVRGARVAVGAAKVARKAPKAYKVARTYLDEKYDIQDAAIMAEHVAKKAKRIIKR